MNPYKKPELKRLNPEDVPADVKAEFDEARAANEGEPEELIAGKFAPRFDVRDYAKTLREILIFQMNRKSLVNDANDFWEAQSEVTSLRNKLQDAYKSAIQKSQMQKARQGQAVPDIWMFGAAAYDLITEQGMRLSDVLEMSGAKLATMALEQGRIFKEKAEKEGDSVYMIKKKSRE